MILSKMIVRLTFRDTVKIFSFDLQLYPILSSLGCWKLKMEWVPHEHMISLLLLIYSIDIIYPTYILRHGVSANYVVWVTTEKEMITKWENGSFREDLSKIRRFVGHSIPFIGSA